MENERMSETCGICGGLLTWQHDHRADNTGLDDGPPLATPRKKAAPKSDAEMWDIRSRAWQTRRQKYGAHGHS
jgi:hypothetical protein